MTGPLADRHLYLCTPDRPDLQRFVADCVAGGVDVVQLREKHLQDRALLRRAALVRAVCDDHGVPFILNDRPDLALAAGAAGVHVGQDDAPPWLARRILGGRALVGLSTHSPADLAAALDEPVDYLSAGPVVPTPTKPGRPGTGRRYVARAAGTSPWPVFVTGDVNPRTVGALGRAGARHFVAVRWLTQAAEPREAARALRRVVDEVVAGGADAPHHHPH